MATTRQQLVARFTRRYPFYSGCTRVANSRWLELLAGRGKTIEWTRLASGPEILVPLNDFVGRTAYYIGDLDPKISWICSQIVRPGDTVLDIGANLGTVTLTLSRLVGPTGRVHAFEPNPRVVKLLESSLRQNQMENVKLHPFALGDVDGELPFAAHEDNLGTGSFIRVVPSDEQTLIVPVRRLSDVAAEEEFGPIRLIKMDVEGFEPQVLSGARDFLSTRACDAILFELNDVDIQECVADHPTVRLLDEFGYTLLQIPRRLWKMRLIPFDLNDDRRTRSHDYLAVLRGAPLDEITPLVGARI